MNYNQPYYGMGGPQYNTYQSPYQTNLANMQNQGNQIPNNPIQPIQPTYKPTPIGLQGKSVDSVDVVKAMDIPLDGSVSYFPLTDGTAIVTKQLQPDGTSKTIVYKPVDLNTVESTPKYVTEDKIDDFINNNNSFDEFKKNFKEINRQIEDITSDISDIRKSIKDRKDK